MKLPSDYSPDLMALTLPQTLGISNLFGDEPMQKPMASKLEIKMEISTFLTLCSRCRGSTRPKPVFAGLGGLMVETVYFRTIDSEIVHYDWFAPPNPE